MFHDLHRDRDGNVALIFALLAPLLLAFVGAGVDYARYAAMKSELQEIADAAAIAGARQFLIKKTDSVIARTLAEHTADSGLLANGYAGAAQMAATANAQETSVTVEISYAMKPAFLVSIFENSIDITVDAVAQAGGSKNICVIGLNETAAGTVKVFNSARLSGARCAVFSNSTSTTGLASTNSAKITSVLSCSAGGYNGSSANFDPIPITDCPKRDDPLADRAPPTFGGCEHSGLVKTDFIGTLQPGVYCGGLTIDGASRVDFADGVFVIKDGHMTIAGDSLITGDNVGFYFIGTGGSLTIGGTADIDFAAPVNGPMAGVLIWQQPAASGTKVFTVISNNVRKMVGTIYLPKGKFRGASNGAISGESAYTAIIADTIELSQQANLVLNTDYFATNVPVPGGLRGEQVVLRQ